jgi:hypothetical protein
LADGLQIPAPKRRRIGSRNKKREERDELVKASHHIREEQVIIDGLQTGTVEPAKEPAEVLPNYTE